MKKKQIQLGKKLILNKETVADLSAAQQHSVFGGQTATVCGLTCPVNSGACGPCPPTLIACPPHTQVLQQCTNVSLELGCQPVTQEPGCQPTISGV